MTDKEQEEIEKLKSHKTFKEVQKSFSWSRAFANFILNKKKEFDKENQNQS